MTWEDVQIGDTVVVREWDDMAAEHLVDTDGDIYFEDEGFYFVRGMSDFCGTEHVVQDILMIDSGCHDETIDVPVEDFIAVLNG